MKKIILFIFLFSAISIFADENCDEALKEGKQQFNAGNYSAACELFRWVSAECGSSYKDVQSWINKSCEVTLKVSNSSISVPPLSATRTVTVTCNRSWLLEKTTGSWYTVSRNGNTLTISIDANNNSTGRNGSFIVKTTDGSKSVTITVSQSGKTSPTPPTPPTPAPTPTDNSVGSYSSAAVGTVIQQTLTGDDTRNVFVVMDDHLTFGISGKVIPYTDVATALKECSEKIGEIGSLKSGTLTENGHCIIIYNKSGVWWEGDGPDSGVLSKLTEINKSNDSINEVSISPNAKYYYIGYQGAMWSTRATTEMNQKLKEYDDEIISSACINDNGDFAITTNKHFYGSTDYLHNALLEAKKRYGYIESISITNKGVIVVCEKGIYLHNVPTRVYEKLIQMTAWRPIRVKFTDSGTYIITDGKSRYSTFM